MRGSFLMYRRGVPRREGPPVCRAIGAWSACKPRRCGRWSPAPRRDPRDQSDGCPAPRPRGRRAARRCGWPPAAGSAPGDPAPSRRRSWPCAEQFRQGNADQQFPAHIDNAEHGGVALMRQGMDGAQAADFLEQHGAERQPLALDAKDDRRLGAACGGLHMIRKMARRLVEIVFREFAVEQVGGSLRVDGTIAAMRVPLQLWAGAIAPGASLAPAWIDRFHAAFDSMRIARWRSAPAAAVWPSLSESREKWASAPRCCGSR